MAKLEYDLEGNGYFKALEAIGKNSSGFIKMAVYEGANVLADNVRQEIQSLPVQGKEYSPRATNGKKINSITSMQKQDLLDGMGISTMKNEKGFINTKIGFEGYGRVKTKKYPKGLPNALLARAVNSGTSFRKKNPFMQRAVRKSKNEAIKAMENELDKILSSEFEKGEN